MTQHRLQLFDSHLHIIDPRFPLVANHGYLPEPFCTHHYLDRVSDFELVGGCVVSGSFQGFDQTYLVEALNTLGDRFVGVTQLPASSSDQQILAMQQAGVRGLRFNLRRGGSEDIRQLEYFAKRVYELAEWHIELYIDARELNPLLQRLCELPRVCIDHLGLSRQGLPSLLKLVEAGASVKATGFGRLDFSPATVLKQLHSANPRALMFGTDLPSTRAPRPFTVEDTQLILDCLDSQAAEQVMVTNALSFYRMQPSA